MKLYKPSGQALVEHIIIAWIIVSSLILFFDLPGYIKKNLLARQSQVETYLSQPIDEHNTVSSTLPKGGKHEK